MVKENKNKKNPRANCRRTGIPVSQLLSKSDIESNSDDEGESKNSDAEKASSSNEENGTDEVQYDVSDPDVYRVEKIMKHRDGKDGKMQYLIRWAGYSSEWDEWQSEDQMNCELLITQYWERYMLKTPKQGQRSSSRLTGNRSSPCPGPSTSKADVKPSRSETPTTCDQKSTATTKTSTTGKSSERTLTPTKMKVTAGQKATIKSNVEAPVVAKDLPPTKRAIPVATTSKATTVSAKKTGTDTSSGTATVPTTTAKPSTTTSKPSTPVKTTKTSKETTSESAKKNTTSIPTRSRNASTNVSMEPPTLVIGTTETDKQDKKPALPLANYSEVPAKKNLANSLESAKSPKTSRATTSWTATSDKLIAIPSTTVTELTKKMTTPMATYVIPAILTKNTTSSGNESHPQQEEPTTKANTSAWEEPRIPLTKESAEVAGQSTSSAKETPKQTETSAKTDAGVIPKSLLKTWIPPPPPINYKIKPPPIKMPSPTSPSVANEAERNRVKNMEEHSATALASPTRILTPSTSTVEPETSDLESTTAIPVPYPLSSEPSTTFSDRPASAMESPTRILEPSLRALEPSTTGLETSSDGVEPSPTTMELPIISVEQAPSATEESVYSAESSTIPAGPPASTLEPTTTEIEQFYSALKSSTISADQSSFTLETSTAALQPTNSDQDSSATALPVDEPMDVQEQEVLEKDVQEPEAYQSHIDEPMDIQPPHEEPMAETEYEPTTYEIAQPAEKFQDVSVEVPVERASSSAEVFSSNQTDSSLLGPTQPLVSPVVAQEPSCSEPIAQSSTTEAAQEPSTSEVPPQPAVGEVEQQPESSKLPSWMENSFKRGFKAETIHGLVQIDGKTFALVEFKFSKRLELITLDVIGHYDPLLLSTIRVSTK